jgi:hypothetical protein
MPKVLTPEQIAEIADNRSVTVMGNIRVINSLFRAQDNSGFVETAIRNLRKLARDNGAVAGFEYAYMLDCEIGILFNKQF